MSPIIPAVLAGLAVLTAAAFVQPVGRLRSRSLDRRDPPLRRRRGPVTAIGASARRVFGRSADPRADCIMGWILLIGCAWLVVLPPVALVWWASFGLTSVVRRRRRAMAAERALVDELPEVVDLLALAVSAGLSVPLAVGVVADRGQGRLAAELGRARRSAMLGNGLADALDEVPGRLGDAVRPIIGVLCGSLRDGTSIAASLERVAHEVRTERRRSAEERARRVSVRLLFPLVCCVLPAFALLTVVPLLAGALTGLVS